MSDEIQNVKIRIVGDTDFSKVEAGFKGLSEAEKQTLALLKSIDDEAKKTNKTLQEGAEKSGKSVKDSSKSFDGLLGKVRELKDKIPGAFAIDQITSWTKATTDAGKGVGGLNSSLQILKVAFASIGIGALVALLGSLVAYFTATESGGDKLAKIMRVVGAVFGEVVKVVASVGEFLVDTGTKIYDYVDGSKAAASSTDDYRKSVVELAEELADLEDKIEALTVTVERQNDKLQTAIEVNLKALRNRNNTLKESQKIISDIGDLEEQKLKNTTSLIDKKIEAARKEFILKTKDFGDDKQRIEELQHLQEISIKHQDQTGIEYAKNELKRYDDIIKKNEQKSQLFDKFINDELTAEQLLDQAGGTFTQKDIERIASILKEKENATRASLVLDERLTNFNEAALEKDRARKDKAAQDDDKRRKDAEQKLLIAERKELESYKRLRDEFEKSKKANIDSLNKEQKAYEKLIDFRSTTEIKAQDDIVKNQDLSNEERLNALGVRIKEELKQNTVKKNILLSQENITQSERLNIIEQAEQNEKDIKSKSEKDQTEIHKQEEEKRTKLSKEQFQQRQAIMQASFQIATSIASGFFDYLKTGYSNDLAALKQQQEQQLAATGDNKQAQAVINQKFAKQEAELKRKAAETDKIQAIFGIAIATAQNVVKALGTPPVPNIPLSILAGTLGAVQLAFVAAKPLPKFNRGTKSVPGVDTGVDSIMAMLRPGEGVMPVDRMADYRPAFEAMFDRKVPAGFINSIVMDYDRLGRMIPVNSGGSNVEKHLKDMNKKLDKLQILEVNMDAKGFKTYLKSEISKTEFENNYLRVRK